MPDTRPRRKLFWVASTGAVLADTIYDGALTNRAAGSADPHFASFAENAKDCVIRNCDVVGVKRWTADDHVEGVHVHGAQDILIENCLFDDNEVMHLFLSHWGVGPPTRRVTVRRCKFGRIQPGPSYFHIQTHATADVAETVIEDCVFLNTAAPCDAATQAKSRISGSVTVASMSALLAYTWGETPPPAPSGDERLDALEASVAALRAALATKATKPTALSRAAMDTAIVAIKTSNPKIAASDQAIENALVKLAGELRA